MSIFKNEIPSNRIILRYGIVTIISVILIAVVLPFILNYPPESINTGFDVQMSYISYTLQYSIICILGLLILSLFIKILFKDIDKWYKLPDNKKYNDKNMIIKLRKKCFKLPIILFFSELLIPVIISFSILFLTGSHYYIMIYKICFLLFSFSLLLAVTSYVFSKNLYTTILSLTYEPNLEIGTRFSTYTKIFMQVLPIGIVLLLVTSLIGYSKAVAEKEDILFNLYNTALTQTFDINSSSYSEEEILQKINSINLYNESHNWFIIKPDNYVISSSKVSKFMIEYTKQLSKNHNGKTYDSYGIDIQGSTITLNLSDGTWYIGIFYDVEANIAFKYLTISSTFLLLLSILLLHIFAKSFTKDLNIISENFNKIYSEKDPSKFTYLPVTSNDEFGDLISSFNNIQNLTKQYIEQIHSNQEMLIEKERLASLGQMIGGIAHNLKTPIMSIAGAAEGISDLIKEYQNSIGDPEVTVEDNHEIASDMNEWIGKIKVHLSYMSDIITAIKGQAVAFADQTSTDFTINELLKMINILMKHELKNAIINLNIQANIDVNTSIKGNINSLVQVVNNIISNAIQAYQYQGKTNENIDFTIYKESQNLILKIQDYAGGLPEKVKESLFKEMITTKGKNGSGLGLFMSYSNIKAHFSGNLKYETKQGEGTIFYIEIPL